MLNDDCFCSVTLPILTLDLITLVLVVTWSLSVSRLQHNCSHNISNLLLAMLFFLLSFAKHLSKWLEPPAVIFKHSCCNDKQF